MARLAASSCRSISRVAVFEFGDPFGRHVARQALEEAGDAGDLLLGAIEILQIVEMRPPRHGRVEDQPPDRVVDPLQSTRNFA